MGKLLSANFSRLWKSKLFWLLEGLSFGIGVFSYALAAYNTRNLGPGWLRCEAHSYFYLWTCYLPVFLSIFAAFFIGTDYSDGTLRNKLIVGRARGEIYLSFLLVILAAAAFFVLAYLLAVAAIGLSLSGNMVLTQVQAQPWRLLGCLLMVTEYGALFTMVSMLDSDKTRNAVICLLLAALLISAGIASYGRVSAPEFIRIAVPQSDGGRLLQDGPPNPDCLTGTARICFVWLTAILPSGSCMLSLDKNLAFDWRNPVCALAVTVLLTLLGMEIFKKKDIK